ncbi:hypothetical protein O6H91_22G064300 [Diphasiastrum complanatum]|uniref:Uncharacterized protein n=6 Tax=Diphasiastrum complanatum TaxID=34168 RepID=A0ACC2AI13_DIPCM|nr:hypothetical protein O6H91_22G064300 [Diphasiastrum complanatum]KAJ7516593.1 hypothetical protein O6H91_22G064300 [Diphasiastrum complanatum]KAJ7516594.1 hypothetical protein O6H91_22G064300 [Diphasiastrum complanatum]KAJ7516599.1 hypothetical protein O6H91_22G064300 [Diphasiastrum complanatum]KAJ7516606.1 hypothetical protein O6H91_22G064300 [Diphasiastrum complanatum]
MDLKKVFDQTVREIKREVNKKVLKVPEIEQKVLDATSNEPWGPHGTLMSDIAQATRNYNEHQMIMGILWKRLNDSGRNWRHVYKALTVLEFLVGHGSERVIDDLREHSYQVQTLVDFQYVEPNGKDQGVNVRKKAQTLVGLVNDKEKIREVRQKAAANRDKYKGVSSTGGIYKSSSYSSMGGSYGGDRYDRDDDRYGGGSRYGARDDDRYGGSRDRDGDRYRDEDHHSRDGDRYGRDGDRFRDDDFGNDRDRDDDRYGSRAADRYSDKYESNARDRDRSYDDDDRHSTRSGGKADDYTPDERRAERIQDRSKTNAPPSYEEVYTGNDAPYNRPEEPRNGGGLASAVARATKAASQLQGPPSTGQQSVTIKSSTGASLTTSKSTEEFDDFDPRASTVAPVVPVTVEQDLFGETASQPPPATLPKYGSNVEDLFGESTFQSSFVAAPATSSASFGNAVEPNGSFFQSSAFNASDSGSSNFFPPAGNAFLPSVPLTTTPSNDFSSFSAAPTSSNTVPPNNFTAFSSPATNNITAPSNNFSSFSSAPSNNGTQSGSDFFGDSPFNTFGSHITANKLDSTPAVSAIQPSPIAMAVNHPVAHQVQTHSDKGIAKPPLMKDKFEPKSSLWADHLSSGLLDLNIAKPKNNPLAELGIHLDSSLTGSERKREVVSAPSTKGKAMGSGTGLGIVGASILNPPPAPPMMGGGMGLGPGLGMGMTPGMGYGVNPGFGMAPRMGMNPAMGPGMGMSMNPAMMQGPSPGPGLGVGMNPSFGLGMGTGNYPNQQQQYGGFR